MDYDFKNAYGLNQSADDVVREIAAFINEDAQREYSVIIGTDSEELRGRSADFVTAVVVHRKGNGGRYFWRRVQGGTFYQLRDRIIKEVMISLEIAHEILSRLKAADIRYSKWGFEIHADIGEGGPTKELIQEVVGIIRANNFEARTKPDSYAASKVADRHC